MGRVPPIDMESLNEEQRRIAKAVADARDGNVGGPYTVWIHNPAVAEVMNNVGDVLRVNGKLDKRLMEVMVLVVAHHWNSVYQWTVHEKAALKAGVSEAVMTAIREGRRPTFEKRDEEIVYNTIKELVETKKVSEPTYQAVLALLGMPLLVELITNAGRYTQAAMVTNAFEITKPGAA